MHAYHWGCFRTVLFIAWHVFLDKNSIFICTDSAACSCAIQLAKFSPSKFRLPNRRADCLSAQPDDPIDKAVFPNKPVA